MLTQPLYVWFTYLTTELEDDHDFTHTCLWGLLFVHYIFGFSYLTTELEVDHDDGDLRHRDDQDDEHKEKETKQVVKLVLPYCLQSTQKELISNSCQIDHLCLNPFMHLSRQIAVAINSIYRNNPTYCKNEE